MKQDGIMNKLLLKQAELRATVERIKRERAEAKAKKKAEKEGKENATG